MNEPKLYAITECGELLDWTGGNVDGRSFKKRNKNSVEINGIKVHAFHMIDGRQWDCINGWRPKIFLPENTQDSMTAPETHAPVALIVDNRAQSYAERVWAGQSDTVPRSERIRRVQTALVGFAAMMTKAPSVDNAPSATSNTLSGTPLASSITNKM